MKKLSSKKFVIALLIFGLLTSMIILGFIIANSLNEIARVSGYIEMIRSIGLVLASGLVTYFVGQSYIDGRKELKGEKNAELRK